MLLYYFLQADGRLVKLSLFSTVLDKSPQTSIYFTTFEKKSQVSPTHTIKLFGFWYMDICLNFCSEKRKFQGPLFHLIMLFT